ncbi:MAG: aminotransferase class I/II-fold pyridoxal phosphate-dependent enzyme, partial [Rhodospirillaceae bacterium]|nr:aminotransferase class I/II-fold pyridoxal phosphate-dependent enzyme [Rhodospirillaceae bacterium]
ATLTAGKLLEDEGFLVVPIRPPTVPDGTARLRITFSANHEERDVDRLAELIRERVLNGDQS